MRVAHLVLAVSLLAAGPVRAASVLLQVSIDGRDGPVLALQAEGGHLLVSAADFRALGLALAATPQANGLYDLAAIPGVTARVDEADQRLLLTVAGASLPRQLYDLRAGSPPPEPQSDSGALLHYDLSLTDGDARRFGASLSGGGTLGLDVFTPGFRVTTDAFATAGDSGSQAARLDSALLFEHPASLSHLILGDAITATPVWARALRFGGVEWASDFDLRPGLVTQPLPAFFGQSDVPLTVDVFSGAAQVFQQDVDSGPFELRNLPVLTGGGSATIVTRDVLGRETTQSISLYTDAGLLAPGLESWALDAGFLRTRYGLDSFGYDTPLFSGSWRRGLSDTWTVDLHGEAAPGLASLGGGGEWGFGFGSLAADVAQSGGDQGGWLASATAHALAGPFNLFASVSQASRGWRDLASLDVDKAGLAPARLRYQLGVTADLGDAGTLGLSWIGIKQPDPHGALPPARALLSTSWSLPLPNGAFAALTALKDLASGPVSAQLSLNFPVGPHGLVGVTGSLDDGKGEGLATFDNPADPDGGFGYRLMTGWQDGGRFQGEADWIGDRVALDGGVSLGQGVPSLRADASGALVFLHGSLFAAHDPGGAVALVETGEKNIRVYRENRPVAVSDDDGQALLTGLDALSPNHVTVEARDYAFDDLVEKTDAVTVPRRASGVVLDFTPASRHALLATVTRGVPLATPLGAIVTLDGDDRPLPLGRDGQLFIADLQAPRGADVDMGATRCRVLLTPGDTAPLLCLREAQGAY